tara:strand:- start:1178 stop:1774 length:597 start_codon:yes stop_codon:yes gene_type:complete
MPWIPAPITQVLKAWFLSSYGTSPYSYVPLATQIGIDYVLAAAAVNTGYGGTPPLSVGTASDIQAGFESSFAELEKWSADTITWEPFSAPREWNQEIPDYVWKDAAQSIVDYWTGGVMSPLPPPPPGAVGANPIISGGTLMPLQSDIGKAFKLNNTAALCNALNAAFVKHLKTVAGTWTGVTGSVPPVPYVFPWVGLS